MTLASTGVMDRLVETLRTYPFRVWGFGESIAMQGLLAAGGDGRIFAAELLSRWAHQAPPFAEDALAHVAPGVPLLEVFGACGDRRLLERAVELAHFLESTRPGQHGARLHRPDLSSWQHTVWVDCMHLDAPFLALLSEATGEQRWATLAVNLLLGHARVLQDEGTGVFSHGFDDADGERNHLFWGRGQGWALLGLTDTALRMPGQAEIVDRLRALVAGLRATEADAGRWHTVVDHPETYIEPSVSAFVALGVGRAVRGGLVDEDNAALAARALAATRAALDKSGALAGASDATPVGFDAGHYGSRQRGVFPWGQAPALLAILEEAPRA